MASSYGLACTVFHYFQFIFTVAFLFSSLRSCERSNAVRSRLRAFFFFFFLEKHRGTWHSKVSFFKNTKTTPRIFISTPTLIFVTREIVKNCRINQRRIENNLSLELSCGSNISFLGIGCARCEIKSSDFSSCSWVHHTNRQDFMQSCKFEYQ